jgi:pimeloyl-ACP methyl ester carboxylesterase
MRLRLIGPCLLMLAFATIARASEGGAVRNVTSYDGVKITYEVHGEQPGEGEPALVFVHCWACSREHWRNQLTVFAKDHRIVAMDLAGHGDSGRDREEWSIAGLAGDVEAVVEAEGLDEIILIGHSMGGPVSMAAHARMPGKIRGIVFVDTVHDVEFEMDPETMKSMSAPFEKDYASAMEFMVPAMFPPDSDPEVQRFVIDEALRADPAAMVILMHGFADVDQAAWLAAIEVPVRAVNAAARPPYGPETKIETNRKYADFDATLIEGVGHYLFLEKPEEFNAALRAWIEEISSP